MITTTGSGANDYARTMSFQDLNGNTLLTTVDNIYYQGINTNGSVSVNPFEFDLSYSGIQVNNQYWDRPEVGLKLRFLYLGGTEAAGTRFKIKMNVSMRTFPQTYTFQQDDPSNNSVEMKIIKVGGPVLANSVVSVTPNWNGNAIETSYITANYGDQFRFTLRRLNNTPETKYAGLDAGSYSTIVTVFQEIPATDEFLTNGVSGTTASYWTVDTSNYEPSPNISVLTSSQYLYNLYAPDIIQTTPTASVEIGYPSISTPFYPILLGDKIKFGLDETDVHTIVGINAGEIPSPVPYAALCLTITPPIDSSTPLNNFTLYRIVNDGTSVILQVKKDISGSAYAGVVQPQFISKELVDNYDKIITDLTEREIIV
jgi:hypothetical protein